MTSQQDSDKAAVFFTTAITRLGAKAISDVLELFNTVDPTALIRSPEAFFDDWFKAVDTAREQAWSLGQAYFRLDTAIWTGATPDDGTGKAPSRTQLWRDFAALVNEAGITGSLPDADVELDPQVWGDYDRKYSRDNAASSFYVRVHRRLKKFQDLNRGDMDADRYFDELEKLMKSVSTDIARESQRLTANGGRDAVMNGASNYRGRRIGYMRVPQGMYTCGFCIMLASRGAVYSSKSSAGFQGVGRDYHAGCDCIIRALYEGQKEPSTVRESKDAWTRFSKAGGGNATDFVNWWKGQREGGRRAA